MSPEAESKKEQHTQLGQLTDFDQEYFNSLEGPTGWIALGHDEYQNQRYFTGLSIGREKVGIVGVYDTGTEKNILHYVVDPKYRGQGLARQLADKIMNNLGLPYLVLTIDLDNKASLNAAEKLPGIEKISDADYEKDYNKVKYLYKAPEEIKKI